jgi:hypothetical protein
MPHPSKKRAQVSKPHIPTGQELYDAIMHEIEPELTTEGVKHIAETYKHETPHERYERKKRYILAFERYKQAYEGYIQTLQAQVDRYRRASIQEAEIEDREQEEGFMDMIHSAILKAA